MQTLTCPNCKQKLPNIWGNHWPEPKHGDRLECGMCGCLFVAGPPHITIAVPVKEGRRTVGVELTPKAIELGWHFESGKVEHRFMTPTQPSLFDLPAPSAPATMQTVMVERHTRRVRG